MSWATSGNYLGNTPVTTGGINGAAGGNGGVAGGNSYITIKSASTFPANYANGSYGSHGSYGSYSSSSYPNLPNFFSDNPFLEIDLKGLPRWLVKWYRDLTTKEFPPGGSEEDWTLLKTLVQDWLDKLKSLGCKTAPTVIQRVSDDFVKDSSQAFNITHAYSIRQKYSLTKTSRTGLVTSTPNYFVAKTLILGNALEEKSEKIESLATLELEILEKGGMILGTNKKNNLLVYFPFYSETAMDKLVEDEKPNYNRFGGYATSTLMATALYSSAT